MPKAVFYLLKGALKGVTQVVWGLGCGTVEIDMSLR